MIRPPRFLRPAQSCPSCGEAPPVRVSMFERLRYAKIHPSEEVQTVACSRCHRIYPLTAAAMARAA